jgi:hypothetical protein
MTHIFHTVSHHYQPIPLVIGASTFHTPLKNFSFFFACLSSPHDRTGSTSSRASGHRPAHSYWPAPVSPSMCAIFKLAPCRGSNICLAAGEFNLLYLVDPSAPPVTAHPSLSTLCHPSPCLRETNKQQRHKEYLVPRFYRTKMIQV